MLFLYRMKQKDVYQLAIYLGAGNGLYNMYIYNDAVSMHTAMSIK